MDLQATGLRALESRIAAAQKRLGELRAGRRVQSDARFSRPFMADHTEFDSFEAFCDRSPWALGDERDPATVPRGELDDYVAATTDFDSWAEMRTRAAEEEILDQLGA